MDFNSYWAAAFTYTILLIIIFINDSVTKRVVTNVERASRLMTLWVIFFCLQDGVWGLCDCGVISSESFFFVSSSIFHISTVITTFFWLYFVMIYLHISPKKRNLWMALDGIIIAFQLGLVIANCFTPTIFSIVDGEYVTHQFRPLAFINQYVIYLGSGIGALLLLTGVFRRRSTGHQANYISVFVASLAPILLGIFQLLYPNAPFYSLGYFLACYLVHIFIVAKEHEDNDKASIFHSISKTYYSMHLIDLNKDKATPYIESPIISSLIKNAKGAQEMINCVINGVTIEDYREMLLKFVDLSTLSERMEGKPLISCEFIGRNYGWTRLSFVSIEKQDNQQRQVMVYTQIIDDAKRHEMELIFKSNNDELTRLYNRYAYEKEVKRVEEAGADDTLVLIAMDINGLKQVNDTLGHAAGDELILGAANCMKQCFSTYGKIFRTGGDEFFAIIYANKNQLPTILHDFEEATDSWKGKLVDSLSVSYGCATGKEAKDWNLHELISLADERMYRNKAQYYQRKGIDRRGQRDAHIALCALYTKILRINLTDDTFQIINMEINEKTMAMGYSDHISEWLHKFGKAGLVHPDDLDEYLQKTRTAYIKDYFAAGKSSLHIMYRRKIDRTFKQVMMEIIPANDFSADNQSFYLFVKNIDN